MAMVLLDVCFQAANRFLDLADYFQEYTYWRSIRIVKLLFFASRAGPKRIFIFVENGNSYLLFNGGIRAAKVEPR
jgi:hypothetical protein